LVVNDKIIDYYTIILSFFPNTAIALAVAFAALAANVAAADIMDNTQCAGDVVTSLLL